VVIRTLSADGADMGRRTASRWRNTFSRAWNARFRPASRYDPAAFYENLLQQIDRPTLVLENKVLYAKNVSSEAPQGFRWEHTDEQFPCTRLCPPPPRTSRSFVTEGC